MGDNICGGPLTLSSRNPIVLQEEAGKVGESESESESERKGQIALRSFPLY
jgi:hypothetical protein